MMNQRLFIMLGYPGSGKSSFARQLATEIDAVRLSADGARHLMYGDDTARRDDPANKPLVFKALDYATIEILKAGYSVVYDVNHNRRTDRIKSARLGEPHRITPIIIRVDVPIDTLRQRLESREVNPEQPKVPFEHVERVITNREEPADDELCIRIDGTQSFAEQLASFSAQLASIK